MSDKEIKTKTRDAMIEETLRSLRNVRKNIDPDILETAKKSIQSVEDFEEIKIDVKKNRRFVMDFLNSPAGAHLKDKILS